MHRSPHQALVQVASGLRTRQANDMVANIYVVLTAEASHSHQERGNALLESQSRLRSSAPKVNNALGDQGPEHRGSARRKLHS
jgi:hypothetical protein